MRLTLPVHFVYSIFLTCVPGLLVNLRGQLMEHPSLTSNWVEETGPKVAGVGRSQWLRNGTLLFFDDRNEAPSRTFEQVDVRSGKRTTLVDASKALYSLRAQRTSGAKPVQALEWPAAWNEDGTRAAYLYDGDIFLLDLPSAQFFRLTKTSEEEKDIEFSPDGQNLAFVRNNNLFVSNVPKHEQTEWKEKQLTADGSPDILNGTLSWVYWEEIFGRKDIGFWWSPDSKQIAFLRTDESAVPQSTFVDFQPTAERIVHQRYPKAGDRNPDVKIGVVSVSSGSQPRWISFYDGKPEWVLRVGWLPDNRRVSVETLNRAQTNLGLYFASVDGSAARRVLSETDEAWINVNDDLYFLKNGREFLWASERDGFMHLYRYDMNGALLNKVTSGNWAMASGGGNMFWVRQAVAGVDEATRSVYFTALKDGSTGRQLFRVNLDGTGLQRITNTVGTHHVSMSPDCRYYLDTYSNIRTLPSLTLQTSDGHPQSVIANPRPNQLPTNLQFAQLTTIPADDGFPMPAQIMRPSNFDSSKRYPVILHIYGGPSAPTVSDSWQAETLFDNLLAQEGYAMVAIDNRAATGISKRLENTLARNPSVGETADLVAGIRWLKKQPWVDSARVGVWGWSGGGTNTLNLMTRSTEFKAGISGAPVTDWHFYDSKWAESLLKLPKDHPDLYESTSLVKRAAQLHGTLLLMFGTYDDNVHPQNEQAFMNALISAGKPYQVELYPMRKHGFVDIPAKVHRDEAMIRFWRANL